MTDTTPLPCPLCHAEAPQVYESRHHTHCNRCGTIAPTTAWNTRANADARLVEALRRMTEVAQGYAEYIASVPSAELERHPYLPGLEDEINSARAALSEVSHG